MSSIVRALHLPNSRQNSFNITEEPRVSNKDHSVFSVEELALSIFSYLDRKGLLTCLAVCSDWRDLIDKF